MLKILILLAFVCHSASALKKGIAVAGFSNYQCSDELAFTNATWWYDWRLYPKEHELNNCTHTLKPGYVPLVWGKGKWAKTDFTLPDHVEYVLGFNEPNHDAQANMTPERAAYHWKGIEASSPGRILVSPSAAPCGTCQYNTTQWLDEFFRHCNGCKVDHIATHAYWCNADTVMNFLQQLWDRYQKPIWLTEFACPQTHSVETQKQFMQQILPRLEAAPHIFRYAWFASRVKDEGYVFKEASLLKSESPALNSLGEAYDNFTVTQ